MDTFLSLSIALGIVALGLWAVAAAGSLLWDPQSSSRYRGAVERQLSALQESFEANQERIEYYLAQISRARRQRNN